LKAVAGLRLSGSFDCVAHDVAVLHFAQDDRLEANLRVSGWFAERVRFRRLA